AVGICCATSSAKLGPDRYAVGVPRGSTWASTWAIVLSRSCSMPLDALTTIASGCRYSAACAMIPRTCCAGLTETTTVAPRTASASDGVARSEGASATPCRYFGFSCRASIASATSGSNDQSTTSSPLRASRSASAVPQLPAPTTAIRSGIRSCLSPEAVLFPAQQAAHIRAVRVNHERGEDERQVEDGVRPLHDQHGDRKYYGRGDRGKGYIPGREHEQQPDGEACEHGGRRERQEDARPGGDALATAEAHV